MSRAADQLMKQDRALLAELGQQLGHTGLRQFSGHISEEFLTQLHGILGRRVFTEMGSNDPIIGAMLYAIEMLMRPTTWTIEPFSQSDPEDGRNAEFVEEVFDDMSHSMSDFIGEWMAAPQYGFAPHEIVWKRRDGFNRDPDLSSQFTDGMIGIAALEIRHPTSLVRWVFEEDKVLAMIQRSPPHFQEVVLPEEKMLFFTTLQRKGNPEGQSLLRRAFVPWFRKKNIEEIESIGIERELVGIPVVRTPPSWWLDTATTDEKGLLETMKRIVKRLRSDEQQGVVLPKVMDKLGNEMLTLELLTTGGKRAIDTGPPKEYYSRQMAMTILADVILLGHEQVGSFALASSKTNLFGAGLGALLDSIEDMFNRKLIPQLMILNGRDPARAPKIRHGDIETPDLGVLGDYLQKLSGAGMALFPTEDGELERFALRAANLPESSAEGAPDRFREQEDDRERVRDGSSDLEVEE